MQDQDGDDGGRTGREESSNDEAGLTEAEAPAPVATRPTYLFFGVVAALTLLSDVLSKAWADIEFNRRALGDNIELIKDHLSFTLAYNRGGAWGLLQDANETLRRPFFLVVSVAASAFIVSLYGKLSPTQRALKWGLPLVLGGALGNLADRVTRVGVVDFIDYRADWVETMNRWIALGSKKIGVDNWTVTDHWPTFNVADIAICIGVALMAIDMLGSSRAEANAEKRVPSAVPPPESEESEVARSDAPRLSTASAGAQPTDSL